MPPVKINGWARFVLSPVMYSLIDPMPFNMAQLNLPINSEKPKFPEVLDSEGSIVPYRREQTLHITVTLQHQKNYYNTTCNIYHAVYNTLDAHIDDAFKIAPATTSPTIEWNTLMTINNIFDQMMRTYGPTTPNAMCQNMMTFLSPYNPQDSPELLFKHSAECQEVAIIANVKYTNKQHLMNVIYLLT
jgi:hypothetical protein